MIRTIDLSKCDADTNDVMRLLYRKVLLREDTLMTMEEAAWLYGYSYATLRHYVSERRIKVKGKGVKTRITHSAMRAYIQQRGQGGRPRQALVTAQSSIDQSQDA